MRSTEWRTQGNCFDEPDLFFSEYATARALCASCPVFNECYEWITNYPKEVKGIVAGTSETTRKKLLIEIRQRPRVCAIPDCDRQFTPRYGHTRLCSPECKRKAKNKSAGKHYRKMKVAS